MTVRVAVVLARRGSVRLPRKNIMPILGKPMVSWAFERAFGLVARGLVDHVAVSTDDDDVKVLAPQGTFIVDRPSELASAAATSYDAMAHAIGELEARLGTVRHLTLLQPTSPLAALGSTAKVTEHVDKGSFPNAVSICGVGANVPGLSWRPSLKSNGLRVLNEVGAIVRVGDDEHPTHLITGAAYAIERDAFFAHKAFILPPPDCCGVEVPVTEAIDVDTAEDFEAALRIAESTRRGKTPGGGPGWSGDM